MGFEVAQAYSLRAAEYIEMFGTMAAVHPSDRQLVDTWADSITGPLIDAGCGPGHWTNHLAARGADASGIDLSAEFVAHARATYAGIPFEVGSLDRLNTANQSVGGVLSWYSLIHHDPVAIEIPLKEFARILRPGGSPLIGFFVGPAIEKFDHAVIGAYKWPVFDLSRKLDAAGFDVIEAHTRTGAAPSPRPHGAIVAKLRSRAERTASGQQPAATQTSLRR